MDKTFLAEKILMTISTIIYGFIPPFADLNKTHATNPIWPGHSRFHVVWQVLITLLIALLSLYFLWLKNNEYEDMLLAFLLGLTVLGSFVINVLLMRFYGGTLADQNGIPKTLNINTNLLGFMVALLILVIGFVLIHI
jgi:type II secretory pathway component PulF